MTKLTILALSLGFLTSATFAIEFSERGIDFKYEQGKGKLEIVKDVEQLTVLSNLNVPKGIFMSLMDSESNDPSWSPTNIKFGVDLYEIVFNINKMDNLRNSTFGIYQDIDFVVAGSKGQLNRLITSIKQRLGVDALEYFHTINTDPLVDTGKNYDRWMQDWGEFLGHGTTKNGKEVSGIYYVNRNRGLKAIVEEISKMLGLPMIESDSKYGDSGNYGGNIEMTPDGTLLYGNTMGWEQEVQLVSKNGGINYAKVDTSWLAVGHFDEQMSVIPSTNECAYPKNYHGPKANYAIVVADPLWGLNEIYNYNGNQKYITYISDYLPDSDITSSIPYKAYFNINDMKKAIKWFLHEDGTFKESSFKNYSNKLELNRKVATKCSMQTNLPEKYCDLVAYNIYVAKIIDQNTDIVTSQTACLNDHIVKVPQIYRETERDGGGISFFPGSANMVVLRDHLIVPEVTFDGFQDIVHEKLAEAVGGYEKVHFIMEKAEYHDLYGEVHCATNVFRETNLLIPNP